jgi:hypothetical protein
VRFFFVQCRVFFSANFFADNVMVAVATKKADNPAQQLAEKMHVGGSDRLVCWLVVGVVRVVVVGVAMAVAAVVVGKQQSHEGKQWEGDGVENT